MTVALGTRAAAFRDRVQQLAVSGAAVVAIAGVRAFRGGSGHALIRCPVHADEHPSCSVDLRSGYSKCFACGWTAGDVVALHRALGRFPSMGDALRDLERRAAGPLPALELGPAPTKGNQHAAVTGVPVVVRTWIYRHADGTPAFEVHRLQYRLGDGTWAVDAAKGKVAKSYRPSGPGGAPIGMPPAFRPVGSRPLLNLPRLLAASRDEAVFVVEGEPAAEALHGAGALATTSSGGANNYHMTDWSPLAGRDVVIWPDNDAPGAAYARAVTDTLLALMPPPTVVWADVAALGLPPGGDAVEWLAAQTGGQP